MPWIGEHTQTFTTWDESNGQAREAVARNAFEWFDAQLPKKRATAWAEVIFLLQQVIFFAAIAWFFAGAIALYHGVWTSVLWLAVICCLVATYGVLEARAENDYLRVFRADGVIH
jgi:hypothetical protein